MSLSSMGPGLGQVFGAQGPHASILHMTMLPPPLPLPPLPPGAGAKRQRPRGGSISGRLRSASDLCDEGVISPAQKGVLKDMIIAGDDQLESAFERYERGDPAELSRLVEGGHLNRRGSIDLLDNDLYLGCVRVCARCPPRCDVCAARCA